MEPSKIKLEKKITLSESLYINKNKKRVSGNFNALSFVDKDTKQYVIFVPSLEVSGYGSTLAKAKEMIDISLRDLCFHFVEMPKSDMEAELKKLGWAKKMFNKQYSKLYVDEDGNLQGLNAENDKVEKVTLTAA